MGALDRVPGPRSPLEGWAGRAIGLVAIGVVLAIAKPWGDGEPRATWSPRPSDGSGLASSRPMTAVAYDPASYPAAAPPAAWAIVTPQGTVALDFLARDAQPGGDGIGSTAETIVSGPVVPLGAEHSVLSIAVAYPAGAEVRAARLWRLDGGRSPVRIELDRMVSPWPATPATVLVRPAPGEGPMVEPWDPGLYRLDLLLGPNLRARSVMLDVDGGDAAGATDGVARGSDPAGPAIERDRVPGRLLDPMLALLPEHVTLWSTGRVLAGWNRDGVLASCSLADIWQAVTPDEPCWPVPLGPLEALGVNLPPDVQVAAIDLDRLDPLPGRVATSSRTDVDGRPGLALVQAPAGGLPDGVYRLEARLRAGQTRTWYVEVGPIGRAVARFNEASTSR